jgi:hypothetical protein
LITSRNRLLRRLKSTTLKLVEKKDNPEEEKAKQLGQFKGKVERRG